MEKLLLLFLLAPVFANGQFSYDGPYFDSTTFTFSTTDTLTHHLFIFGTSTVTIDTSSTSLWQIGKTLKPVFSNGITSVRGIMTDTLHHYPANANGFFVLKISSAVNCIVDFWHKYQTDSLHAGGIVEFSTDSATWLNIAACPGIDTQNFYTPMDTLHSGQPAFTGTSNGEQLSRFQLMNCHALRTTATACFPDVGYGLAPIYIRFRFVSDTTIDSLSGWMIDSIKIVYTGCGEGISNVASAKFLTIFPNPATTFLTISSANRITNIAISNLLGQEVYSHPYDSPQAEVDVADLAAGIYLIRVNGTEVRKFVKQ
jgi:hypothetical protein